jgi:Zn-dependent protease
MHPSFLLLVAFALLGLLGPWFDGLVWIVLIFASIVVHELGHALVARRRGLVVRDIVLMPIGGASEIEGLSDDARHELAVAIAGPITSVALALVLGAAIVLAGGSVGAPSLSTGSLPVRVLWANLMLAAFNLLPVLPMDGGRVLRAAWARDVGYEVATARAARLGRVLAIAMGAVGVLYMPWLVVIAVFVYVAGRAEATAVTIHARLGGLVVRDAMTPIADTSARLGTLTIHESDPLEDAVEELATTSDGIATVVDQSEQVVGVLLLRRVAELLDQRPPP